MSEDITEYYLAGDPAKQHDFFGIVLLERTNDSIRLLALKELRLDYTIVANYIESLSKKYHVRKIFLDQTGIGNVFLDMLKSKGLLVEGLTLSNPKKVEIIETVIRLMQEQRIKLPKNGAEELKTQLQEQQRDLTQSGMIRFVHPSNAHDDLFWAFCIGVYAIKRIIDQVSEPILYGGDASNYAEDFSSLLRPGVTMTDVAIWWPSSD